MRTVVTLLLSFFVFAIFASGTNLNHAGKKSKISLRENPENTAETEHHTAKFVHSEGLTNTTEDSADNAALHRPTIIGATHSPRRVSNVPTTNLTVQPRILDSAIDHGDGATYSVDTKVDESESGETDFEEVSEEEDSNEVDEWEMNSDGSDENVEVTDEEVEAPSSGTAHRLKKAIQGLRDAHQTAQEHINRFHNAMDAHLDALEDKVSTLGSDDGSDGSDVPSEVPESGDGEIEEDGFVNEDVERNEAEDAAEERILEEYREQTGLDLSSQM